MPITEMLDLAQYYLAPALLVVLVVDILRPLLGGLDGKYVRAAVLGLALAGAAGYMYAWDANPREATRDGITWAVLAVGLNDWGYKLLKRWITRKWGGPDA